MENEAEFTEIWRSLKMALVMQQQQIAELTNIIHEMSAEQRQISNNLKKVIDRLAQPNSQDH